jgi:hypothetical protein
VGTGVESRLYIRIPVYALGHDPLLHTLMKVFLFIAFLLAFTTIHAQQQPVFEGGLPAPVNKKHIFRTTLTFHLPEDEYVPLAFNYERMLGKQLSLYTKAGPSMSPNDQSWDDDDFNYSLNVYASAELRFYFNQLRRERKEKKAHNFSSNYISVEQYIISNPLLVHGKPWKEGQPGSTGTFLNIGLQRQFGSFYLNVFWGPRLSGTLFGDWPTTLGTHRGGISLGFVLFE